MKEKEVNKLVNKTIKITQDVLIISRPESWKTGEKTQISIKIPVEVKEKFKIISSMFGADYETFLNSVIQDVIRAGIRSYALERIGDIVYENGRKDKTTI